MIGIIRKFFRFADEKNRKKFSLSVILSIFLAMFESLKIPAIGIIVRDMVYQVLSTKSIITSVIIMLISIMGSCIIRAKSSMLQTEAGYGVAADKRMEIAEHLRYLPMGYFNLNSLGAIAGVTTNTMENLSDVATRIIMLVTAGLMNTAWIVTCIVIFDYRIGLIVIGGLLIFMLVNSLLRRSTGAVSVEKIQNESDMVSKVIEQVKGITEVKQFGLVGKHSGELHKVILENVYINTKIELRALPYITLQNTITKLIGVVMTLASVYFYINGTMLLHTAIMMTICSFMIYTNLENAGTYSSIIRIVDLCVNKATEILSTEKMDIDGEDITPDNYNIDIKNVSFSYDKKRIIDNISLSIKENTTTAIVGPSGSGKTTLCHLIARFWDVNDGEILLGGRNIKEYSMDSLMKNFSFVFQSVYLFNDTIANNIRFGNPDASMDDVMNAAKKARCHNFIMEFPDGYDTIIGEGGASLSGGEKQRISIARAIMKDAPIIILDEATANVDPENEKGVVEAIDELTQNKTIFMIAHRLKTVKNADRILVVDEGKIVQDGTHDALIKEDGIYKRFVTERNEAVGWKL